MANFDVAIKKEEVLKYRCKVPNGYVRLSSVLGSLPRYADDDAARTAGLKDCELYINEFGNITAFGRGAQSLSTYVSTFEFNEATNSLTVNLANGDVQQIDLSDLEVNDSEILSDFDFNAVTNQVDLFYVDGTSELSVTIPAPPAGQTVSFVEYTEGTPNTITVTYSDGTTSAPVTVTGISTQTPVVVSVSIDSANNVLVVTSINALGDTVVENIPLASALDYFFEQRRSGSAFTLGTGQTEAILNPINPDNLTLSPGGNKNVYIGETMNMGGYQLGNSRNIVLSNNSASNALTNKLNVSSSRQNIVAGYNNTLGPNTYYNYVIGSGNTANSNRSFIIGDDNNADDTRNSFFIGNRNKSPLANRGIIFSNTVRNYNSLGDIGTFKICMKSPELNVGAGLSASTVLRDNSNQSRLNFLPLYADFDHAILNVDLKVSGIISNSTTASQIGEGFNANVTGLIKLEQGQAPDLTGLTATSIVSGGVGGATMDASFAVVSTDELEINIDVGAPAGDSINVRAYGVLEITYTAIA